MNTTVDNYEPGLETDAEALAEALARLPEQDAVSLPLLDQGACRRLVAAAEALPFRTATPVIGEAERAVFQDFDLCEKIPAGSLFHALAAALERLLAAALARLADPPLAQLPPLKDLILQRYPAGSAGITPHRDHIRYRGLVAIVTLAGRDPLFVCADRSGRDAREVPMPAGSLLLMRAPPFAGRRDRPFHVLKRVSEERLSLGIRHDAQTT